MEVITQSVNDKILKQCLKEYEAALKYRHPRIVESWHPNEELYYSKKQKKLKGRHNIQFGDMQGFVDTMLSKIDDIPQIKFQPTTEADFKKAKKVTKQWELDSSPLRGDWAFKDLLIKKLAILYGRGIAKYIPTSSNGIYLSNLVLIDPYDFVIDPMAGGENIENASYMGHDNIFKSIYQLEGDENYDQKQIQKIKQSLVAGENKDIDNELKEKQTRLAALNLDTRQYKYQGQEIVKFCESYTTYQGERYICTFDLKTLEWMRVDKLKDVFTEIEDDTNEPLWPIDSWAPNPDAFEFWSPSPCDQVRDSYIAENILINQSFDNRQYRNFGMKMYDTDIIKNPALLEPRWAGLVPATPKDGRSIQQGIYEFQYPSLDDTPILHNLIEQKVGKNSGITPGTQGLSENDKKVGVFEGELAQAADRLGLSNRSYSRFWIRMGKRYINGLKQHATEEMVVKMIGENGVEWDKIVKEDLNTKFDIIIVGSNAELQTDARKSKIKLDVLNNEKENNLINQKLSLEKRLEIAGFEAAEIKELMDTKHEGEQEILAEAADENEKMLTKDIKPNEGATSGHIQKHLDFVKDNDLKPEIKDRIIAHADAEIPFARKNMVDLLAEKLAEKGKLTQLLEPNAQTDQYQVNTEMDKPTDPQPNLPNFPNNQNVQNA